MIVLVTKITIYKYRTYPPGHHHNRVMAADAFRRTQARSHAAWTQSCTFKCCWHSMLQHVICSHLGCCSSPRSASEHTECSNPNNKCI